jgi:adhesin transport system membrane fusion protein
MKGMLKKIKDYFTRLKINWREGMVSLKNRCYRMFNRLTPYFAPIIPFFTRLKDRLQARWYLLRNATSASTTIPIVNPFTHLILWCTLVLLIVFLIWAKFAVLQESTSAQATVIPVGHVQSIQNLEGGIINKMMVREGQMVDKNEVLVYLDPTRFVSALNEIKAHIDALKMKAARLSAETQNKPFVIDDTLMKNVPDMVGSEQQAYESHELELSKLQRNRADIETELNMTKPLVKDGAVSPVDVLHLERELAQVDDQIAALNSHELEQLESTKTELNTLNASLVAAQDRLDRTTIRSPVKGIVKQISISTKNGVVQPGTEIMSIVPLDDNLLIEAQVKPSDIGFIHADQEAMVHITAYDYSIYGGLSGRVDEISADTVTDKNGQSYYLVHIKTKINYLRTADNPLYIIPGMTGTVNILTGKRTVMSYLLSPLVKARENALQER